MTKIEPKSSRTIKGKIISRSIGEFQDDNQPISQDLLLSDEEIDLVIKKSTKDKEEFWMAEDALELVAKAQVQHLIDLGWRPSSLPNNPAWQTDEKLFEAYCAGQNSLIQVGWESPSEVEALIKDERAKVLKELRDIMLQHDTIGSRLKAVIDYVADNLKGKL